MGERRWTEEQLSAINTRDRTLLVSAAAGSGKTATLTERIIRQLTDKEPVSVDSLLVVTFTNAAAAELRTKISKALSAAVAADPLNKRLEQQLYMLPAAKIKTIDSFCNDILRDNSDRVGVPSNYRIADTAECELLAISIIEGMIESVYNGLIPEIASPDDFERLADCLTDSKRTEELAEIFRVLHLKCETEERGVDSLLSLLEIYDKPLPVEENPFGAYLMSRTREMAIHYAEAVRKRIAVFTPDNGSEGKYIPVAQADLSLFNRIMEAKNYVAMRDAMLGAEFVDLPRGKKVMTDAISSYTDMRKLMKEDVVDLKSYFIYDEKSWETLFSSLSELLSILYRFVKRFDLIFTEEKRNRGALSYADIERYTYNCLRDSNGEPTDVAMSLRERFSAVYIDEYQDVNNLQNRIFEVISRPRGRFMVGDIKQSIYGFRSARPEIFAEMKNAFPRLDEGDGDTASVFMSSNFRCNKAVVDFVNGIFDRAFGLIGETVSYGAGDRLGYAKIHENGEPEYRPTEIHLIDKSTDKDEGDNAPRAVALKIAELLKDGRLDNGEPIKPSDIAIIMRNARGKADRYVAALTRLGIPTCISGAKEFFASSEILLTLCLLNSIDNPRRDIYLAGLMCSPLFGFTADELYLVRTSCKRETLYEALVDYSSENKDFKKGVKFLETLAYYRAISEGISVDALIYKLYHETGLLALAAKSGGKDNLMVLYDYARSFSVGAYKGLYGFISFVNNLIDKKTTFDDAREGGDPDAVKLVTCHASKGLEYPIVFLVDTTTRISNKEKNNRLVYSEGFGIAMRLRTPSGLALVENPVVDIIHHYIERKQYEEELRVLYVALTRARERLFVYGTCPLAKREDYENKISVLREDLSRYSVRALASMMEIILVAGDTSVIEDRDDGRFAEEVAKTADDEPDCGNIEVAEDVSAISEELTRRFTYEYPSRYLTELPEKMSVSTMSPCVLDGTESEAVRPLERDEGRSLLPAFADGGLADESAKRGIATHYFMQFCDFERLEREGAKAELSRLVSSEYLSKVDGERVRLDEIEAFRRSALFSEMRRARNIYREFRFNVRLPAEGFTSEEERARALKGRDVLVQGVIDCIVEQDDGSLCLYDYKTDRLTREERDNPTLAKARLRKAHREQLELYALAVEKIFGRSPTTVAIYSLHLGDTVDINQH